MAGETGQQRFKLPYDAVISPRSSAGNLIGAEDIQEVSPDYIALSLVKFQEAIDDIARKAENRSYLVDEYNTVPLTGSASQSTLSVLPTYEYMPEKIESVIVAGPAASTGTLILGDRQLPFVVPATGLLVLAPVAIILGRNDPRQLTSATPGIWFLELMGVADKRFDA